MVAREIEFAVAVAVEEDFLLESRRVLPRVVSGAVTESVGILLFVVVPSFGVFGDLTESELAPAPPVPIPSCPPLSVGDSSDCEIFPLDSPPSESVFCGLTLRD